MSADHESIGQLIWQLMDANWQRCLKTPKGFLNALFERPYRPQSDDEQAIWNTLTAPHNFELLSQFIADRERAGVDDDSVQLGESLMAEARRRLEREPN